MIHIAVGPEFKEHFKYLPNVQHFYYGLEEEYKMVLAKKFFI